MKTYKLTSENIREEYPIKYVGNFDPYLEYYMFDQETAYLIRKCGKDIYLINLFSFTVNKLDEETFKNLPKHNEVFVLPHYTGGCCDYDREMNKIEYTEKAKMFRKIADFASRKAGK